MVVVPTLAAKVNCIGGSHCLILPKAEFFCDCGVSFLVVFPSPSSLCPCGWYPCELPTVPNGVPLPLGIYSRAEREVFQFLCFAGIADQGVHSVGGPSSATKAHTTRCFTQVTVDRQQRATTFGWIDMGTCETF